MEFKYTENVLILKLIDGSMGVMHITLCII